MNQKYSNEDQQARNWYGDSRNTSGRLNFEHVKETADLILEFGFKVDEEKIRNLYLAGLGHDLFEDTKTDKKLVTESWGEEPVRLIEELTNLKGDGDFDDYLKHLSVSSAEVVIVKLADILSNLKDSLTRFLEIDKQWLMSFWLPLLKKYQNALFVRKYSEHSVLIKKLKKEINAGISSLEQKLKS